MINKYFIFILVETNGGEIPPQNSKAMEAYKIEKIYSVTSLTENEKKQVNELLIKAGFPALNEWIGTDFSLVYNEENNMIELWDGQQKEMDLISPEVVKLS